MLLSTFKYLPGLKRQAEAKLWQQGILTLDDLCRAQSTQPDFFNGVESPLLSQIGVLKHAVEERDFDALSTLLYPEDYYRVALTFPEETLFLDIETTGLSRYYDKVTLVGWKFRSRYGVYIRGGDSQEMLSVLERASVVVTYNGTLFDLPFILKEFPKAQLPQIHVDLRYLAKRVGLTGGQKAIEGVLGILRPKLVRVVEGELAPVLWAQYRRGSIDALKQLIRYNHADVQGLCVILDSVTDRISERIAVPSEIRATLPKFGGSDNLRLTQSAKARGRSSRSIAVFPYRSTDSTFTTLKSLYSGLGRSDLTIVGIDLTGSEQRPSGWCKLHKFTASTHLIASDADLIKATVKAKPDVISIDSPLSLPRGRSTVFDDDPGRAEFGIMRTCERILKRRGINVYPSLLPSMQKLTARGIRLAAEFRKCGLAVIESYPGAAQDIMNIPRKRAGLELLEAGLREFGVRGPFLRKRLSHDELDAITSALVGVFFLAGRFEALGDESEEALIVPDLNIDSTKWLKRRVFGFSGPLAAGKTTAARVLERKGFAYGRYSMVLSSQLEEMGKIPTRQELQEYGLYVNRERGQRWLGRELLRLLPDDKNIVIDGMRFPDDRALLVERYGLAFRHLHVEASADKRRARFESRESARGGMTFEGAGRHEVEDSVLSMKYLKDAKIIRNDSDLRTFERRVDRLARR
jgi:uncharacterized protein YprB with RNaseH-like and TPR domain/predicted nuclease with RNAse H fold/dephospho-CoA kinase